MAKYEVELTEQQKNGIEALFNAWWLAFNEEKVELKEVEPEKKEWPQMDDKYWFIKPEGSIETYIWTNALFDIHCLSTGNCFRTKEEAEFEVERLKVIHELKQFAEPEDREWGNSDIIHHTIYYDFGSCEIEISHNWMGKHNTIYFASREDAEKAIESVGAGRIKKFLFGINEAALE